MLVERMQLVDAELIIVRGFVDSEFGNILFEHYLTTLDWKHDTYKFGGVMVESPRLIALIGEKDYTYSVFVAWCYKKVCYKA